MGPLHRFPASNMISLVGASPRHDLGESFGPELLLGDLLDGGLLDGDRELAGFALGYGTAAGDPQLRAAIAAANGVTAEDVVVTAGGMHALFLIAFTLCDPGDEVLTVAPLFPLARNALDAVGATVRVLPLSFDDGYRLDPERLRAHLTPATRLVSLASPQNPSGVALPQATVERVLEIMAEVAPGAHLLLDETYREAAFGDDPTPPSAAGLDPRVISVASLSKCHGAAGLRIGWAISRDRALVEQLVVGKFNTVLTCAGVSEQLALRVFERADTILSPRRKQLAAALRTTADWVERNAELVEWVRPDAGALCCVRLRPTAFPDSEVEPFYAALTAAGARVAQGAWFGDEARVFRLGFGFLPAGELEVALEALTMVLHQRAGTSGGRPS
ncbi:pyridoxal phosphate-dependent aminotransferase [Pseudonocardia sp. GCM10023141]|uniref:pyridoxal phosphate-dependent aminotransferase n=1 Tax=Pseudonocardia sp. GCM10023141 TaxID=3252653 RepID=UPI003617F218